MRFANIGFSALIRLSISGAISGAIFGAGFGLVFGSDAAWSKPWQIFGREALNVETAEPDLSINKFNQKLTEILPKLNPNQPWRVDIRTTRAGKSKISKSALIRLEGFNLIFITLADANSAGFESVPELANIWAQSLSNLFGDPNIRKLLVIGIGQPPQIRYRDVTYYLKPEIAADRGLFRTSGQRFMGRVVYWEVAADNKAYQISQTTKALEPSLPPTEVFILNQKQQFLTYSKDRT